MRKLLLLITIVLVVLLAIYRNRVFLRDPIAKLERNGLPVTGAEVYINYSNDVLVFENSSRTMFIVQNWNHLPGTPTRLKCIQMLMCLTEADQAVPTAAEEGGHPATMTNREVTFTDAAGSNVRVQIR